ncbi:MAG TPA: ABC transporter permease [Chthoniobacterales bacterium]|nr:ABC transporter permease [Chthoniobacterales bacterium]
MNDLRYAFRQLIKSPGFTFIAVLTLALGIGANSAIFSVIDTVLLLPLPYPHSEQIVTVSQTVRSTGVSTEDVSPANFIDWQTQNSVFSAMACAHGWPANLSGGEQPERVRATVVSAQFFSLFGAQPILGRTLGPNDAKPGNSHVVVLGHELWVRRFGGDRSILGRDLLLDGEKFTVVGIVPAGFSPDEYGELWVPSPWDVPVHPLSPNDNPREMRDRSYLDAWARLKTGVTLARAQAEMSAIAARLEHQYPDADQDTGIALVPLHEQMVGGIRPMLLMLLGAVSLVLLIACANVANLLLARAAARSREIAIRTALGASRLRLVRQLLTESSLLAALGGALGVLLAVWALPVLLSFSPPEMGDFNHVGLNGQVLIFSLITSVATGALFGLAPAFFASRSNPNESLREGERGSSLGKSPARSVLIAAEIALSLVLLVGAGLMMKSFVRLTQVNPGFNPDHLLVFNIGLPSSAEPARQISFYEEVVERLRALPGVESVGAVSRLPLAGGNSSRSFNIPGSGQSYDADIRVSTPEYFKTMGISLLKGRNFAAHDAGDSLPVAIINETAAANVFPGQDPIGKYLTNFGPKNEKLQIVGVVGNVHHVGLETAARPEVYLPLAQSQWPSMYVAVRSAVSNPLTLIPSVQEAVWSIDRNVPLANPRTMQDVLAHSVLRRRFAMLLLSIFAGLATLLAAIGLYGVISYSVAQRTKEIGIRMALGGQRSEMLRMVLRQSGKLVSIGMLVGVPVAFGATHLLGALLYGIGATDITTYLFVIALLGAAAFFASIIPAFRATKVDPMVALRYE